MATPQPRTPHPLSQQPNETVKEWAKRIRRERGPMPEAMQNRINAILRTAQTAQRPTGHPETPPRT